MAPDENRDFHQQADGEPQDGKAEPAIGAAPEAGSAGYQSAFGKYLDQGSKQPESQGAAFDAGVPWEISLFSGYETFPVRLLEILAVLAGIFCVDFFCYQGTYFGERGRLFLGPSGWAAFFAIMPAVFFLGSRNRALSGARILLTAGIWLAALKIWFSASALAVFSAGVLLIFLGAEGTGVTFHILALMQYVCTSLTDGGKRVLRYFGSLRHVWKALTGMNLAATLIPLAAVLVFGAIFVMANPLLQRFFLDIGLRLQNWLTYLPPFSELVLWCVAGWLLAGFLMPRNFLQTLNLFPPRVDDPTPKRSDYYQIGLNTLVALCVLFAANLIFEFFSIFFIPRAEDFDYGTYCHHGAAWITFALCLTTVVQAFIFSGDIYRDDRVSLLKRWTVLWTMENFLLVGVIYNRLCVYVMLNGLTWLRIVGFLGVTAVALGLFWVLWKLMRRYDLPWLIRRFAVTVAGLFYLFSVAPVDTLVYGYNTRIILAGNPGPTLHLFMQNISPEGWCQVFPLLESENSVIREGAAALLVEEYGRRRELAWQRESSKFHSWRDVFYTDAKFMLMFCALENEVDFSNAPDKRGLLLRSASLWYWDLDTRQNPQPVPPPVVLEAEMEDEYREAPEAEPVVAEAEVESSEEPAVMR